jgi:23S rRNA (guanine745-N1)-methyltransferase
MRWNSMEVGNGVDSRRVDCSPLACSVRGCALPLFRHAGRVVCARGHSFDEARSGYLNLLQPNDRRSPVAGDAKAAVEARARLLASGVLRTAVDAVVQRAARLDLGDEPSVVDLGSGSGEALAELARVRPINGVGIDLSTPAIEHAAKRFPGLTWVVANADRRLPLLDGSVDLVLSLHARRNPAECARVLHRHGFLLVAIPASDDLIELRAVVQGEGMTRDRTVALLTEHTLLFTLLEHAAVRKRHRLERQALLDLLRGTYRAERERFADRVEALEQLEVTLASEIFLFARR